MQKTDEPGVFVKKNGQLWVKATHRTQAGQKEKTRTMKPGATMQEALAAKEELYEELRQLQDNQAENQPPTTIADYAELWLVRKALRRSPSTVDKYTTVLSHHVLPELGHLKLNRVSRTDMERWIAWAEQLEIEPGVPYALDTIRSWWAVLRNVMRDAYVEGLLERDVTMRVTLPEPTLEHLERGEVRDKRSLTLDELRAFLDAARQYDVDHSSRWYPEVLTLATTGMRCSELYGLRWDAVDMSRAEVCISARMWRGHRGKPKTGKVKTVPMVPELAEALAEHRRWLITTQHPGLETGLVFPSTRGTPRTSSPINGVLDELCEATDIEIAVRTHTFRRTLRTLLRRAAVHDNVAKAITGHVTDEMAERYDRVSIEDKRVAISGLAELLISGPSA